MMSDVVVVLEGVCKYYLQPNGERFEALKRTNLHITKGECIILSGVSGSGKSTLLSLIGGLDKPTKGKIVVNGEWISKLPDLHISRYRAKEVGMVFQHFNLFDSLSVEENVMLPLTPHCHNIETLKKRVANCLEKTHIAHKASQRVSLLSGGEKQRCAIARALVNDPSLILCDEPTANLDADNTEIFLEMIEGLYHEGKTLIIATHDPRFASLPFPHRLIEMREGEIVRGCGE
jgi:putative ABC transport system ATP-binding protein